MNNYFIDIKTKLKKEIKFENIEIIDNSFKHKKHKSFDPNKLHLHIKIKSLYLNSIPRINAQRLIMKILKDDFKDKIHALEISIKK
tara:strand:- start:891 stop:1148 length:258 start_codon:yes stop_codon:yes gene_type:complete